MTYDVLISYICSVQISAYKKEREPVDHFLKACFYHFNTILRTTYQIWIAS